MSVPSKRTIFYNNTTIRPRRSSCCLHYKSKANWHDVNVTNSRMVNSSFFVYAPLERAISWWHHYSTTRGERLSIDLIKNIAYVKNTSHVRSELALTQRISTRDFSGALHGNMPENPDEGYRISKANGAPRDRTKRRPGRQVDGTRVPVDMHQSSRKRE